MDDAERPPHAPPARAPPAHAPPARGDDDLPIRTQRLLRDARFDDAVVMTNTTGAGVLPVARRPSDGQIVFLLAKEQHVPSWRGSYKWSAFEGGRKSGEDVVQTALREWREESMQVISPTVDESCLREERYVVRFTLSVMQGRRPHGAVAVGGEGGVGVDASADAPADAPRHRYHVMYAVEIAYDEACVGRFAARREALLRVRELAERLGRPPAGHLCAECDVDEAGGGEDEGGGDRGGGGEGGGGEGGGGDRGGGENAVDDAGARRLQDEVRAALQRVGVDVQAHRGQTFDANGVSATVGDDGEVRAVHVHADYLEKHQVRWWTLAELRQVLSSGGRFGDEMFRAYFLPVLEGMTDFFAHLA